MKTLREYDVVVADRYTASNLAYGTAHRLGLQWLEGLDEGLPEPDVVIIVDVPVPSAFKRKKEKRDIHENDRAFLLRTKTAYLRLARKYRWKIVRGIGSTGQVHENIWSVIRKVL